MYTYYTLISILMFPLLIPGCVEAEQETESDFVICT